MKVKTSRRKFLKVASAGAAVGAISTSMPYFIKSAKAAANTMRFLGAENVTGNWDPTANTTLANVLIEMQTFDQCVFYPMPVGGNAMTVEHRIVESTKLINPFVAEYKIRKGVKFHNGQDCTAEDVKASIEYATSKGRPRGVFPGSSNAEVIDSHTVRVSSEAAGIPINNALTFLHTSLCVLSAEDIASKSIEKTINGTGPYKFVGQKGDSTILEANPNYYLGKPAIDRLVFSYVPDATTRVLSLLSGEAEFIERLEAEQFATLQDDNKVNVRKTMSIENKYLHFRCGKKPFNDARIRRAAAHAIDRSAILEIMGIAGTQVDNLLPRGKMGYTELTNIPDYNPEKCQELLAAAGYPRGEGLPELEYITSTGFYPKTKEYGELIQAFLQEQGFPVKMTVHEVAAWNERIYNPAEGHLVDVGWAATTPEPGIHLNLLWHSPPSLITGLDDTAVNAAIQAQLREPDLAKRAAMLAEETYPLLAEKLPSFPLFTSVMLHGMSKRLKDVHIYPDGSFNLMNASLN